VIGIVLVIGSVSVGALVMSRADATRPVVAVDRDLAAGTVVDDADLRVVRVRIAGGTGGYVERRHDVAGKVLLRALGSGDLVPGSALGSASSADTTLTVPVEAENTPEVERGDRVAIWLSTPYCRAVAVLADVPVQDVRHTGSAALSASAPQSLVVRVDRSLAQRVIVALALDDATVRIGLLSGPPVADANEDLPDLAVCAPPTKS
jgi:hypothetical protein